MAAFSVPALAPAIAADLGVDGAMAGYFVAMVYGLGIVSSLTAARMIHRHGAVRMSQAILLATIGLFLACSVGTLWSIALGALILGSAYGAGAPTGTHLLVPLTPPGALNRVISTRQIGVPLGAMLAALALPPLAVAVGWRATMLIAAIPCALLAIALEAPRRAWDRKPASAGPAPDVRSLLRLLAGHRDLQILSVACLAYAGVQVGLSAFLTVQLTSQAGFDLVFAGQALATFNVVGALSRPLWGWLADWRFSARQLMAIQGIVMGISALAAGQFGPGWPPALVFLVCAVAGATATGYTGVAYAEYARLGGGRGTETTGIGSSMMFGGALLLPSACASLIAATGSYAAAYGVLAAGAILAALLLAATGLHRR